MRFFLQGIDAIVSQLDAVVTDTMGRLTSLGACVGLPPSCLPTPSCALSSLSSLRSPFPPPPHPPTHLRAVSPPLSPLLNTAQLSV